MWLCKVMNHVCLCCHLDWTSKILLVLSLSQVLSLPPWRSHSSSQDLVCHPWSKRLVFPGSFLWSSTEILRGLQTCVLPPPLSQLKITQRKTFHRHYCLLVCKQKGHGVVFRFLPGCENWLSFKGWCATRGKQEVHTVSKK